MTYKTKDDFFDRPRSARKATARQQRKATATKPTREPLAPRNAAQADLIAALQESPQVFAIGPAGTGKTYIAARHAIRMVLDGRKERVVIARATVSKPKHRLGFRPGDQNEKIADWMVPLMDGFRAEAGASTVDRMHQEKQIEFLAFETMRGRSFPNVVAILDEAQNCDLGDLRMFLTRVGEGTQVIVSGDMDQVDIPDSGLQTVIEMIEDQNLSADICEFAPEDVVRSAIAKEWVRAFTTGA